MKVHVGRPPCLDPSQEQGYANIQHVYGLEKDRDDKICDTKLESQPDEDPRFTKMKLFETNEYNVQTLSGVLDTLKIQPRYTLDVPDINVKKQVKYNFFYRAAHTWTCSRSDMNYAMNLMYQVDVEKLNDASKYLNGAMICTALYLAFVVVPVFLICFCVVMRTNKGRCMTQCLMPFTLCCECVCSILAIGLAAASLNAYKNKATGLTALDDAIDGCMDQYSDIPEDIIVEQLEIPVEEGTKAGTYIAAFAGLVLFKVLCILGQLGCWKGCPGD